MIRRAFASLRVSKLPRKVPSSPLVEQQGATLPLMEISSGTAVKNTTVPSSILWILVAGFGLVSAEPRITFNHCQVPCGIFDDPALIGELRQACTTIRKAMRSSKELHPSLGSELLSVNQLVRWINTKEEHCNKIIRLVSEYCLCQRVKPSNFKSENDYLEALKIHHRTMQAAMKAKQSMDEADCIALEHAVEDLAKMYTKET